MNPEPEENSFSRYLAAKKELDDRSLNRQVREALADHVRERRRSSPLRVLEVGCGSGTMLARLLDWRLLDGAAYTGIDHNPHLIEEARRRFCSHLPPRGPGLPKNLRNRLAESHPLAGVVFEALDLFLFLARERDRSRFDLIIAHAFLDLVDLKSTLPGLLALLAPGSCFYFTLNFDGATIFEPVIDPELDRLIETRYHHTMDQRRVQGRPSGSSVTGRRLFGEIPAAGGTVVAAGPSHWLVYPGPDGYPGDEAYFLRFILHTLEQALEGDPQLPAAAWRDWLSRRRVQIEQQKLVYFARQLDFFGRV